MLNSKRVSGKGLYPKNMIILMEFSANRGEGDRNDHGDPHVQNQKGAPAYGII